MNGKIIDWLTQCNPEAVLSGVFALVGAIIGVAGSLSAVFLTRAMQKHGKITLHARIVGSRIDSLHRTWGYRQTYQGISFHIPLWLDICNTSDVSKIVRNVNLCIIKDRTIIADFIQFQGNGMNPQDPDTVIMANEGAYSFVVPPNSVLRAELEFGLKKNDLKAEDQEFDSIYLTYFDEKDCLKIFFLENIPAPHWVLGVLPRPTNWKTLQMVKSYRQYKYRSEKEV